MSMKNDYHYYLLEY